MSLLCRLRRSTVTIATGVLLLTGLAACSVNPVTGENQFSIVSAAQEVDIGRKQYIPSQQSQGGRYTVDPELTLYVSGIGKRLAAVSARSSLPYEFVVLNSSVPNAWALPGGKIAINRGLLVQLEDEAQLAAVLSHEIVHAAARHGASQMSQGMLLGLGGQLATAATQNTGYGGLVAQGTQLGSAAWQAKYGRNHELESDYYGMEYMAKAGYDPVAAVELQQTFVKLSAGRQSDWLSGLFASHPPSQERVDKNRLHAAKLYGKIRNRSQFQRAISQITKDQKAYDTHTKGMETMQKKQFSQAETLFASARKLQPKESLFWVGEGQAEFALKKYSEAKSSFSRAVSVNPEYFLPLLGRGMTEKALGNNTHAEQDLIASQKLLPTQTASYALGEINLQQGDRQSAIGYFQQVAQAGGSLAPAAQKQLQALQSGQ